MLWSKNAFPSCLSVLLRVAELFPAGGSIRPRLIAFIERLRLLQIELRFFKRSVAEQSES